MHPDTVTEQIIGAGIAVHRELGPGLLESTYRACMDAELADRGLRFERECAVPVNYKGRRIDCGFRVDFLVEGCVVVELKAVAAVDAVHLAQILTYLKLARCQLGLLMNFNVVTLTKGVRRVIAPPAWFASPRGRP